MESVAGSFSQMNIWWQICTVAMRKMTSRMIRWRLSGIFGARRRKRVNTDLLRDGGLHTWAAVQLAATVLWRSCDSRSGAWWHKRAHPVDHQSRYEAAPDPSQPSHGNHNGAQGGGGWDPSGWGEVTWSWGGVKLSEATLLMGETMGSSPHNIGPQSRWV